MSAPNVESRLKSIVLYVCYRYAGGNDTFVFKMWVEGRGSLFDRLSPNNKKGCGSNRVLKS